MTAAPLAQKRSNRLINKELKKEEPENDPSQDNDQSFLRWASYSFEFMGVVGVLTYAGWWADQKWSTDPWLTITGFFTGFVGMIYLLIKELGYFKK